MKLTKKLFHSENMLFCTTICNRVIRLRNNNRRLKKRLMRIDLITKEKEAKEPNNYIICISTLNSTETLLKPITINQLKKNTIIVLVKLIVMLMTSPG